MTQMAHGMEELLVHGMLGRRARARETIDDSTCEEETRQWDWREVLDNKGVPKNLVTV